MTPTTLATALSACDKDALLRADEWRKGLSQMLAVHSEEDLLTLWDAHWKSVRNRAAINADLTRTALAPVGRKQIRLEFIQELPNFTTANGLLEKLLIVGRTVGISTIRYYSYSAQAGLLESVDSAGHPPLETEMLRMGAVQRTRPTCLSGRSDAFVCIDSQAPVLFTIDPSLDRPLHVALPNPEADGRIRRARQREWQTGDVLPQEGSHRIEVPLIQAGVVVGKLSCGLGVCQRPPSPARLEWFCKVAEQSAAALHSLQLCGSISVRCQLDEIRDDVNAIGSLDKFFDYCADEMPMILGTRHASILTASKDATDTTLLILRRTSYPDSRALEKGGTDDAGRVGVYPLDDPFSSITGWAAFHRRTARLQQLRKDDPFFVAQLYRLDPRLQWSNTIQDSTSHDSLLVVPLVHRGRLLGVVRFTEKAGDGRGRYFSPTDERHLSRLACDFLAPRLQTLLDHEADGRFCELIRDKRLAVAVAEAFDGGAMKGVERARRTHAFKDVMTRVVGPTGGQHLFLANRILEGDINRIKSLTAGSMESNLPSRESLISPPHTPLVDLALSTRQCVYLHDLDQAERLKMYRPVSRRARSAIACPVRVGPNEQWVLMMLSDRWDFYPEVAATLLTRVAEHSVSWRH